MKGYITAADPGNGIVAQALLSVSGRSAHLHPSLVALGSDPLDPATLRACFRLSGEKQDEKGVAPAFAGATPSF